MARRRLLLLLKPFDMYPAAGKSNVQSHITSPPSKVSHYLDNRRLVHKEAISLCQDIVREKFVDWKSVFRSNLSQPIRNVDLVITIGGDGTLLQASHFIDDAIPVLGVNSDPTQAKEVEEFSDEFDATRSTGHLCAATIQNFEQILDAILENQTSPSELSRMSIGINSEPLSTYALNDVLIAHPCPATVSRFSFRIKEGGQSGSPLVNCRSSGLRISTATGSSAAIRSAGGFTMPILSKDLQYIVREPILPGAVESGLMHGLVKFDDSMDTTWFCKEGQVYIDGSHIAYPVQYGDTIEVSSKAPTLNVFLPHHLSNSVTT